MSSALLRWFRGCIRQASFEYALLALPLSGVLVLAAGLVFGAACQHFLSGAVRDWTLAWLWEPVMRTGMVLHDTRTVAVLAGVVFFVVRLARRPAGSSPAPRWAALAVYLVLPAVTAVVLDLTDLALGPGAGAGAPTP